MREGRAWSFAALGVLALGLYSFAASFQPDAQFGRILAAYGGIFVAGSLAWPGAWRSTATDPTASPHENALPLMVTYGWPGSTVEQLKIIGPLTDPSPKPRCQSVKG